jgi:3',5'-cyclic AMP phosphodiesterase CpdA
MRTQRLAGTLRVLLVASMILYLSHAEGQVFSDTVRFAFVSDLHIGRTDYNGEALFPARWIEKALMEIERKNAEFIFLGGDLIESSNSSSQYAMFDSAMQTALPWYPMAGNHDVGTGPQGATMEQILTWIQRGYGRGAGNREYYGFLQKSICAFFVLNTQAYGSTVPAVLARADSQLVEMDSFFAANAAVPNKFVCSHVPLFIDAQNEDSTGYFSIGLTYRRRIIAVMNKHKVRYYLAGHRHVNAEKTDGTITVYANTALSFQLGSGNQRGYYIYTVTPASVRRDFYPLSQEPDMVR